MADEKKSKIIEGEILGNNDGEKKTSQFVSEKMVGGVVLIIVLILVGYFAYDPVKEWFFGFWNEADPGEGQGTVDENKALKAQVETLQNRLAALETRSAKDPSDLDARLKSLEEAIANLNQPSEGEEGEPKPDPRVTALAQELAALKQEMADKRETESVSASATYAQAVAALSPPLYQSLPYEGQIEQVRILVLEMPALSQATLAEPLSVLSKFARSGIPALETLHDHFQKAGIEALKIEGIPEDAGWWERTWARIKGVVVVRRTDGAAGSDLEKSLNAAQTQLSLGRLGGAISIVEDLPEAERIPFAPWLEEARGRQAALEAFNDLVEFIPLSAKAGDAP